MTMSLSALTMETSSLSSRRRSRWEFNRVRMSLKETGFSVLSFNYSVACSRQKSNATRTHNHNQNTRNVDDIRDPVQWTLYLEIRGVVVKPALHLAGWNMDLHVLNGGDGWELQEAGNDKQDAIPVGQCASKIFKQFNFEFSCCPYYYFLFIISESVSNPG
jgi:hypothetical protein